MNDAIVNTAISARGIMPKTLSTAPRFPIYSNLINKNMSKAITDELSNIRSMMNKIVLLFTLHEPEY